MDKFADRVIEQMFENLLRGVNVYGEWEPVAVVKPDVLENIVWDAMVWALQNPGTGRIPEYTAAGNSFAEQECRAAVRRITSALSLRSADEVREEERERCARIADAHLLIDWLNPDAPEVEGANRMRNAIAAAIRAGGKQS